MIWSHSVVVTERRTRTPRIPCVTKNAMKNERRNGMINKRRNDVKNIIKIDSLVSILVLSVSLLLPACGNGQLENSGNSHDYRVGGSVSNLLADGLVVQNNGSDDHAIPANSTSFTFPTPVADGASYNITVKTQPETQYCMVSQNSGTVSRADVGNVDVQCSEISRIVIRGE
jgi:hypothetical protein